MVKTTVKLSKQTARKYPWMGVFYSDKKEATVILFSGERKGTIIHTEVPDEYPVGHYIETICEAEYKEFQGQITLSNE